MILRIGTALVLIPIVLAVLFYAPLWLFLLVVDLFLLAGLWEFNKLAAAGGGELYRIVYPAVLLMPWAWRLGAERFLMLFVAVVLVTLVHAVVSARDVRLGFPSASSNVLALTYLGLPFALLADFHPRAIAGAYEMTRALGLLQIFAIVWMSDGGAYFVGKAVGRHRVSKVISPNKTAEGYAAAVVCGVLGGWISGMLWLAEEPLYFHLLAGLIVSVAAILGDLFESLLKRGAGIKDTSSWIPGHGGVLDRVDSLLFAVPTYYLLKGFLS